MIAPAFSTPSVTVYCGDALAVLRELPDASVDCVVTSPPYAQLVNYDTAAPRYARGDSRKNRTGIPAAPFADWLLPILAEVARLMRPGAVLALNLNSTSSAIFPEEVVVRVVRECGLRLHERVAWVKSNAAPTTNMRTHLIPAWEPVYVFTQGAGPAVFDRDAIRRPYSAATIARYRSNKGTLWNGATRHARSERRWNVKVVLHPAGAHPTNVLAFPPEQRVTYPHPARFPEALPAFFISAYTARGGVVLDPFAGSGTTLAVARDLDRLAIGVEILPKFVRLIEHRCAQLGLVVTA